MRHAIVAGGRVMAIAVGCVFANLALRASAAAVAHVATKPAPVASTALSAAPVVARVRFDVTPGGAAITHDLVFPAAALSVVGGATDAADAGDEATIYVAFTAQARPLAFEASLHALDSAGKLVEPGRPLATHEASSRPSTAALILGSAKGAGHVVSLPTSVTAFGIRIRSAIPTLAPIGARELSLIARLGVRDGAPLSLRAIEVGAKLGATLRGARATLCRGTGDTRPLTVTFPDYPPSTIDAGTLDPASATRSADDDLCIDLQL